jgi:phosphoribosylformimino-5-aminoimidazole carboxamide ribotide isomerase
MIIYPAIDLRGGRCVRLQQGDFAAETVFADDPVEAALRWASEGATWLHVVNLDGALGLQSSSNLEALRRILAAVRVPVQFGGGVRSVEDVARLLGDGVARVILGTVALHKPAVVGDALQRHGADRIVVGIDAREGRVAVQGWTDTSAMEGADLAQQMGVLGVTRIVYTDIGRDGMLSGVNAVASAKLARASGLRVIASGGVASLDDIRVLRGYEGDGVEGVIIGMALYRGLVSLPKALMIAQGG